MSHQSCIKGPEGNNGSFLSVAEAKNAETQNYIFFVSQKKCFRTVNGKSYSMFACLPQYFICR